MRPEEGPWAVRQIPVAHLRIGLASDPGAPAICMVEKRVGRSDEQQQANARLICAAPTMLKLLRLAVSSDVSASEFLRLATALIHTIDEEVMQ